MIICNSEVVYMLYVLLTYMGMTLFLLNYVLNFETENMRFYRKMCIKKYLLYIDCNGLVFLTFSIMRHIVT